MYCHRFAQAFFSFDMVSPGTGIGAFIPPPRKKCINLFATTKAIGTDTLANGASGIHRFRKSTSFSRTAPRKTGKTRIAPKRPMPRRRPGIGYWARSSTRCGSSMIMRNWIISKLLILNTIKPIRLQSTGNSSGTSRSSHGARRWTTRDTEIRNTTERLQRRICGGLSADSS